MTLGIMRVRLKELRLSIAEVHKKIGAPSEIMDDGKLEIFKMTSDLTIQVVYSDSICVDVFAVQ